jgi:hypothetical protein
MHQTRDQRLSVKGSVIIAFCRFFLLGTLRGPPKKRAKVMKSTDPENRPVRGEPAGG